MPRTTTAHAYHTTIDKLLIAALLIAIWLLSHPYQGIVHDGQLYAAQALQRLNPAAFRNDIFFAYGSQDKFTLFTPLYGWLIEVAGLNIATIGLLLTLQALWFIGYWMLCRQFLEGRWLYLALILAFGMAPRFYGGFEIFSYAEPFVTARLAAEAFGLIGMAIYFSGRRIVGLLAALFATALHPLIGIWVLALLLVLRFGWRWSALAGGVLGLALALIKPSIVTLVLTAFDAEWRALVLERSPMLFPDYWESEQWSRTAMSVSLVLFAAVATKGATRLLWLALTVIGILGLMAAWIGAVNLNSVLVTQLQLWRVLWLVMALQWLAIAQVTQSLWPEKMGRLWLAWLFAAWLLQQSFGGALGLAVSVVFWISRNRKTPLESAAFTKWVTIVTLAVLAMTFATWLPSAWIDALMEGSELLRNDTFLDQIFTGFALTEIGVIPLLAAWWILSKGSNWTRSVFVGVLAAALLASAVVYWDQRDEIQHFVDTIASRPENRPFRTYVESGDTVYWQSYLPLAWFGLRTAHYVTLKQAAGIVFSRDTALETKRRLYQIAGPRLVNQKAPTSIQAENRPRILRGKDKSIDTADRLIHLCHDPLLDFVVLPTRFPELSSVDYPIPVQKLRFWLYECGEIRKKYPDALL
jgi:hypothetical protein